MARSDPVGDRPPAVRAFRVAARLCLVEQRARDVEPLRAKRDRPPFTRERRVGGGELLAEREPALRELVVAERGPGDAREPDEVAVELRDVDRSERFDERRAVR
jgi:hypothetical protein